MVSCLLAFVAYLGLIKIHSPKKLERLSTGIRETKYKWALVCTCAEEQGNLCPRVGWRHRCRPLCRGSHAGLRRCTSAGAGAGLVNAAVPLQAPKPSLTPSKTPSATAQLLWKYPWRQFTTLPALTVVPVPGGSPAPWRIPSRAPWRIPSPAGSPAHGYELCKAPGTHTGSRNAVHGSKAKLHQERMHELPYGKGILKLNPETQMRSERRTVSLKGNVWGQPAINWKVLIEYAIDCAHIRQLPVYYTLWAV